MLQEFQAKSHCCEGGRYEVERLQTEKGKL